MLWYLSIAAGITGIAILIYLFTLRRAALGWNKLFQHGMVTVVIALFLTVLAPAYDMSGGIAETLFSTIYTLMQTASIQLAVSEFAEAAHEALTPGLATLYLTILNILAIVTPALIVSTALFELRKWVVRNRIRLNARGREAAYAFSGMGDNDIALARDILQNAKDSGSVYAAYLGPHPETDASRRPIVVFCNVSDEVREERSAQIAELNDLYRDDVVLTSSSLLGAIGDLSLFPSVHCFMFSENRSANVEEATALYESIARISARRPESQVTAFAGKFHLYCLHSDPNDELVFDSISHRKLAEEVLDVSPKLLALAKDNLEVRLFSDVEERIYGLFSRVPLFLAFKNAPLFEKRPVERDGKVRMQMFEVNETPEEPETRDLTVLVCGLGTMGLEALKAAYWFGRMRGVNLHVCGIDQDGDEIARRLEVSCPVMMAERASDGTPVVEVVTTSVGTDEFDQKVVQLARNSYVYAVVTLGNDQYNLDAALHIRRTWERLRLSGQVDERRTPLIAPLIYSEETFAAAQNLVTERGEQYLLTPFGRSEEVYSFQEIIGSTWERRAIAMNAAYDECWAEGGRGTTCTMSFDETLRGYNRFEIKKLSNRTSTRHIAYRLWSVGIDPADYIDERGNIIGTGLTLDLWLRTLLGIPEGTPVDPAEIDRLFEPSFDGSNTPEQATKALAQLRSRYPLLCALADIEHERWAAFYASHGWRGMTIEECERLKRLGIIKGANEHQSALMRMHCYLCDLDTLTERGIALGEDPCRYDRAAILETCRIISGAIFTQ